MKKLLLTLSLAIMMATGALAIPAKPGLWQTLKLKNGTEVKARLCGDEHVHFWMTEDGQRLMQSSDTYVSVTQQQLQQRAMNRRTSKAASRLLSPRKKVSMGDRTHYFGTKKGIVILAQFTDVKFKTANNLAKYKRIMNEEGYSEGSFRGSVSDYFKDQSAGQFELDFDVVGPYTMKNNQSYYGKNDSQGNDMNAEQMIKEACQQADSEVNFADYDWDGDGEVDQVFVLYAGKGEADGGATTTIWPHMYTLEEGTGSKLTLDGVTINTYACSNEITPSGTIEGIGCFCHEFSHCMGFPDFYDTSYSGWFGMGDFDLMCAGSYNGNTFCPAGYTAHEKMMCGWQEPIVLSTNDTTINNLQPMSKHGATFIIYNDAHTDEYFMIENRQKNGWDAGYPDNGLMITHTDFDKTIWQYNCPNTMITKNSYEYMYGYPLNDHQRFTIVHADNDDDSQYWSTYGGYYTKTTEENDLFPYNTRNSLSATTTPVAKWYNNGSDGTTSVKWSITDIKQNSDGTMSFKYKAPESESPGDDPDSVTPTGDYLFYESFNQCTGTGGNDGLWSGSIATATFKADNEGWTALSNKMNGGNACAKFGTATVVGQATTPAFTINGQATLKFKAGAWNSTKDGTTLIVEAEGATITPATFNIEKGNWTNCEATLTGTGTVKVIFTPVQRFFLDEVMVTNTGTTNIQTIKKVTLPAGIYTLDGRYMGTDRNALPRGIYIVNGRKYIK